MREKSAFSRGKYFKNELLMMLVQAGFDEVSVRGGFTEAEATPEHTTLVFIARK